jgi:Flp pilus assembly protein TadG
LQADNRRRLGNSSMPSPASTALFGNAIRRFRRNRRGSAAVEFALIAPVFFALLFAIFETAMVFFASQVLETGIQDSGRLIYTSQNLTQAQFKTDFCGRVGALFPCNADLCLDVRTYAPGTAINIVDPIDGSGAYVPDCQWQTPQPGWTSVVRAFYPWPLVVTGLGYNISNINRGSATNKRLLAATSAFIPQ